MADARASDARGLFARAFHGEPAVIASAPARVNLIGEHTDYNGGEVLPIAIDRRTFVAVRVARGAATSRAVSAAEPRGGEFDARRPRRSGEWWDYVAGVAGELYKAGADIPVAIEVAVTSNIPAGAGLSSSAALEIATATALVALAGDARPARELALLSQRVESGFVGVACGIMDQFASALARQGHALRVWCD
ncbi:MAG: galactokinase, partial [Gemmatimonadota bacterium]|nr:galactokinase [Gemmatimonadota bacterium]